MTNSAYNYYIDADRGIIRHEDFLRTVDYDVYSTSNTLSLKNFTLQDIVEILRSKFDTIKLVSYSPFVALITIFDETEKAVGFIDIRSRAKFDSPDEDGCTKKVWESDSSAVLNRMKSFSATVDYTGHKDVIYEAANLLAEKIGFEKTPTVLWHYSSDQGHQTYELEIHSDNVIKDEYYPFIKGGVDSFMESYLKSSESVLLLIGPPGTGKSTFLRNFIMKNKLTATLTYDEKILQKDSLFVNYMTDSKSNVLILEDADVILEARETAGNTMMHKLLNISDGIIKIIHKKVIFTTNLPSTKSVDEALLRRGRCFAVVNFRELTFEEAVIAAKAANKEVPTVERNYTLSEIFNPEDIYERSHKGNKIGFGFM